jgi:hypothetical protein
MSHDFDDDSRQISEVWRPHGADTLSVTSLVVTQGVDRLAINAMRQWKHVLDRSGPAPLQLEHFDVVEDRAAEPVDHRALVINRCRHTGAFPCPCHSVTIQSQLWLIATKKQTHLVYSEQQRVFWKYDSRLRMNSVACIATTV